MRFRKNSYGVITVFISLMLVSILSLGTLVIEIARYQTAKTQLSEANISASTSMIAGYDTDLYKRYGLLAGKSSDISVEKANDYLNYNSDLAPTDFGSKLTRQYSINDIEVKGMYNLTYPAILKRQLLSRAKYNIVPQDYALNRYNYEMLLPSFQIKCKYIEDVMNGCKSTATSGSIDDLSDEMLGAIKNMHSAFVGIEKSDRDNNAVISSDSMALLPSKTGTIETEIPNEDKQMINDEKDAVNSLIGADASVLFSSGTSYSDTTTTLSIAPYMVLFDAETNDQIQKCFIDANDVDGYSSNCIYFAGKYAEKMNEYIDTIGQDADSNLLLNSYITEYFSSRNRTVKGYTGPVKGSGFDGENGNFVSSCVEYTFGGYADEKKNQQSAFNYLIAVRMIDNLYNVLTKSNSFDATNSYVVAAHIIWAYYESFADAQLMARYNTAIPFFKDNLIFDINSPEEVANAFSTSNLVTAFERLGILNNDEYNVQGYSKFSYLDNLSFALWFVSNKEKLSRVSDLIQLEMRYNQQYVEGSTATFLMSDMDTYCRIKVKGKLNSVLPVISSGQNGGLQNITVSSTKYSGF